MPEAYIVDAARTAVGRRNGGFASVHPADFAAHVIRTLVERNPIDPADVEDVVWGCLDNIGAQAGDIARTAALAAGLPETVPGVTIDRQCGSSQQAVSFGAMGVRSGFQDLVVVGGVQKMSQFPLLSAFGAGEPYGSVDPWTDCKGWEARYGTQEISQFRGAEMIAEKWHITREDTQAFALESHRRALAAIDAGDFEKEITVYEGVSTDEGPRRGTSAEKMSTLPTLLPGGVHTAAAASQISDGAAALLIASEAAVKRYGLTPRARIHHISVLGDDPVMILSAPIPATQHALKKAGMTLDDIDAIEINEAFASVALSWQRELDADPAKVNPNGGAIALGHPIGASGNRLVVHAVHELVRRGGGTAAVALCGGGGQGDALILTR